MCSSDLTPKGHDSGRHIDRLGGVRSHNMIGFQHHNLSTLPTVGTLRIEQIAVVALEIHLVPILPVDLADQPNEFLRILIPGQAEIPALLHRAIALDSGPGSRLT